MHLSTAGREEMHADLGIGAEDIEWAGGNQPWTGRTGVRKRFWAVTCFHRRRIIRYGTDIPFNDVGQLGLEEQTSRMRLRSLRISLFAGLSFSHLSGLFGWSNRCMEKGRYPSWKPGVFNCFPRCIVYTGNFPYFPRQVRCYKRCCEPSWWVAAMKYLYP